MRKIGTITTASSFIFLGVSLLISQFNEALGYRIFRCWPALLIMLGLEFLYVSCCKKENSEKGKFNFLIIFVIIMFFLADGIWSFTRNVDFSSIGQYIENSIGYYKGNKVSCGISKSWNKETFTFKANNGHIEVKPAEDNMITFQGYAYLKNGDVRTDFQSLFQDGDNELILDFSKYDIKGVDGTLYVPNKGSINLFIDNGKISNNDKLNNMKVYIESKNTYIDIANLKEALVKNANGAITVKDCENINIENANGKIKILGETPKVNIDNINGAINIDNKVNQNIKVRSKMGAINLNSEKGNVALKLHTDNGNIKLNDEGQGNTHDIEKVIGSGEGNIDISTNTGYITVNIRE